ncbi:PilZ domain-containing protein [Aurantiacibacter sp. MUD11]|uniref:PilZ domain-containing protein n=1 Tax=Aurantiacibacter sp. MUD11 TaxID=3003265 RepID=UPI0022AA1AA0|nr:PilZ domain-containing protein [Aurantiacibacter sp. MUD11]WAT19268.1 PilZ domain-containing protein [Aurantiacibacter sp. MUD11]
MSIDAMMKDGRGAYCRGVIKDISEGGCYIEITVGIPIVYWHYAIKFAGIEAQAVFTAWTSDGKAGLEFSKPLYSPIVDDLVSRFPNH